MRNAFVLFFAAACGALAVAETPLSVWCMPTVWLRHSQLRQQFAAAVQRGDVDTMEKSCREGVKLIPGDPTWHYNLACSLAYRASPGLALTELDKAVDFGFRNADAIAQDSDLQRIAAEPRFAEIVAKARKLANEPIPGRPAQQDAFATYGGTVTLNATNVVWNYDVGLFVSAIKLAGDNAPSPHADRALASKPDAPERPYLAAWLSEGSASGNGGDLYFNRDRGHSSLAVGDFPLLTTLRLDREGVNAGADLNLPNLLSPHPIFGNASRAHVNGVYWRSLARGAISEPGAATRLATLYLANQFWVFPAHKDFGDPALGDCFPCLTPYCVVAKGSSWADQPFLRAALAASAALRPPTKKVMLHRHLMGPTMQWLLRSTMKGVADENDYLSSKAHPTVFAADRLDAKAMIEKAHALRIEEIPPVCGINVVNSRLFPIPLPVPGRDYPDTVNEFYNVTPCAIGVVLRGIEGERTFLIKANAMPEADPSATFAWRVVNGDARRVKISTPLGETVNGPSSGFAQITVDRRGLTNRLDVAVFVKSANTAYGAPSYISFYPIPGEARTWRADGQIDTIDYSNPAQRYCDPLVSMPRSWKDVYRYDKDGKRIGFDRWRDGKAVASFVHANERIVDRNADGSPKRLVSVQYVPRTTGNPNQPMELTWLDAGQPYYVK